MSDFSLTLIPTDPFYVPPDKAQKEALAKFEKLLPNSDECRSRVYDAPQFIDCSSYLEAMLCPACGRVLPFANAGYEAWWHQLMGCEEGLASSAADAPCCGARVRLFDIEFHAPCGFARFELRARNPGIPTILNEHQVREISQILGCGVKQIRQRL